MRRFFHELYTDLLAFKSNGTSNLGETYLNQYDCVSSHMVEEYAYLFYKHIGNGNVFKDKYVVVCSDDTFWVSVILLTIWLSGGKPIFANSNRIDGIIALPKDIKHVVATEKEFKEIEKNFSELRERSFKFFRVENLIDSLLDRDSGSENNASHSHSLFHVAKSCDFNLWDELTAEFKNELKSKADSFFTISQMTSGSTGQPKMITRTLKKLLLEVHYLQDIIPNDIKATDTLNVATVPIFHAYGLMFRYFVPIVLGLNLYRDIIEYEEQFNLIAKLVENTNASLNVFKKFNKVWVVSNPGFFKRLGSSVVPFNTTLLQSAGGFLKQSVLNKALSFFKAPLFEILGSTETGVMAYRFIPTVFEIDNPKEVNSWHAFPKDSVVVITESPLESESHSNSKLQSQLDLESSKLFTIKNNGLGALATSSPYIEDCYKTLISSNSNAKSEEASADIASVFAFKTEDQIELDAGQGTFKLLGRSGRILKLEDNRISLDEIEEQLRHHEYIADAATLAYTAKGREYILAVVVLTSTAKAVLSATTKGKFIISLRSSLMKKMLPITIPRKFIIVDKIPLTPNQKVSYQEVGRIAQNEISNN